MPPPIGKSSINAINTRDGTTHLSPDVLTRLTNLGLARKCSILSITCRDKTLISFQTSLFGMHELLLLDLLRFSFHSYGVFQSLPSVCYADGLNHPGPKVSTEAWQVTFLGPRP